MRFPWSTPKAYFTAKPAMFADLASERAPWRKRGGATESRARFTWRADITRPLSNRLSKCRARCCITQPWALAPVSDTELSEKGTQHSMCLHLPIVICVWLTICLASHFVTSSPVSCHHILRKRRYLTGAHAREDRKNDNGTMNSLWLNDMEGGSDICAYNLLTCLLPSNLPPASKSEMPLQLVWLVSILWSILHCCFSEPRQENKLWRFQSMTA